MMMKLPFEIAVIHINVQQRQNYKVLQMHYGAVHI